ncbi:ankyrin repeat domain-containing protein [Legionella maioricensis]|uniref:Ankyrin repeat domain-containing protein n=1 Tax=Legionella maioricensis TaxID=2896528 RepID=A0A9X2ICP8_9GAMM|nr:ankyrin repeat domain-containing protein [Legionella maioricensis]MCL9684697.1 ankyrin repeat domain-containing protein [Legionella maioricensis]MCL9687725.1 ankyrin repeat domain-containing protein [Legionella maioricensis]
MLSEEQVRSQLNTDQMDQTDLQQYLKIKQKLALLEEDLKTMVSNNHDYNREQYVEHIHGMLEKCTDLVRDMQNIADQEVQLQLTSHIQLIEFSLSNLLLLDESFFMEALTPQIRAIFSDIKSIRSLIHGKSDQSMVADFNTMPAEVIDAIFLQGLSGPKPADEAKFFYNFSLIDSRSFSVSNRRSNSLLPNKLAALNQVELKAAQMAFVRHDRLLLLQESLEQERMKSDEGLLNEQVIDELIALAIKSNSLRCMKYLCSIRELDIVRIKSLLLDAVRSGSKCTFWLLDKLTHLSTELDLKKSANQVYRVDNKHLPETTLLIEAARQGNLATVKYLIEHCGAKVDLGCPYDNYDTMRYPTPTDKQPPSLRFHTPLVTALQRGHYEVASYLIDKIKKPKNRIFNLSSVIHEVLLQVHITHPEQYLNFVHELTSLLERKEMRCNYFNQPGKLSRLIESELQLFSRIECWPENFIDLNAINQFLDSIEPWMSLFPEEVLTTDFSQVIKLAIMFRPQLLLVLANNGVNLQQEIHFWRFCPPSNLPQMKSYSPFEIALLPLRGRPASSEAALLLLQSGLTIKFLSAYQILNASVLEKNPLLAAASFKCTNTWLEHYKRAHRHSLHSLLEKRVFSTEKILEAFIELENPWECIYILQKFPFRQTPKMAKDLFELAFKFRSSELINILLKCALNNELDMSTEIFSELCMEPMLLTHNSLGLLLDLNERSPVIDPVVLFKHYRETGWDNLSDLIISRYPSPISLAADASMNRFKFFPSTQGIKRKFEPISLPLETEEMSDEETEEELFGLPLNKKPRGI